MSPKQAIAFVERHGIVLQAARGPLPSLAERIAGGPIQGSWWGHPKGKQIFRAADAVCESPEVLVCKLVRGKVTYVHRRLWPALVKLAPRFRRGQLAKVWNEHTPSGAHRSRRQAFPGWVPAPVLREAKRLSVEDAEALLSPVLALDEKPARRGRTSGVRRLGALAVFGLLAAATALAAPTRDPAALRPGLFLYASPEQRDPNFVESVVLLVEHNASGSMGLVVNRPTRVPLRELLTNLKELNGSDLPFYWGGPVEPEALLALVRMPWPSASARTVLPEVHLTGDLADVREALAGGDPGARLRVFTGYAGWGKGQLAAEVKAGAWVLDRADPRSIFAPDASSIWFRVYRILEQLEARLGAGRRGSVAPAS